jgi:hypothetical protein
MLYKRLYMKGRHQIVAVIVEVDAIDPFPDPQERTE